MVSGRAFQRMGAVVPECSLTISLVLNIFGLGNSNERPSCRTEGIIIIE